MKPDRVFNVHGHLRLHDDLDARVRLWREWNVEKFCCLCLHRRWRDANGYLTNDDFPAARDRYPDILIGMAHLNLFADELARPDDVERFKEQGFAGLKCLDASYPYSHEANWPLYEMAEKLRMPILFHTGCVAPAEDGSDGAYGINAENLRPYHLDKVARAFPQLTIIAAHLGTPHFHESLALLDTHPNVYFDICGGGGGDAHVGAILRALAPVDTPNLDDPAANPAREWFRTKLLFGTDNPEPSVWIPQAERILDTLGVPNSSRACFYWNTAAGLFDIE